MQEDMIVKYIAGEVRVPDSLWAIVKKYRQLQTLADADGGPEVDAAMNKLYDALEVL